MSASTYTHDEKGHRIDVHRPSAINPGDYEYLHVGEARKAREEGGKLGGPAGTCHHCGKAIVWQVYYRHLPSDQVMTFGYICAGLLDMTDNRIDHEMNMLKRRAENERREDQFAQARSDRFAAFIEHHRDLYTFVQEYDGEFRRDFIARIKWGIETYGSPLDWQIEGLKKFIEANREYIVRRQAETALLENAPLLTEGRQHVEGEVMNIKHVETQFGMQTKMLVQLDDGNKVYGTVPSNICDVQKGARVAFEAKIEPKEDHFGFYSRPTKAKVM